MQQQLAERIERCSTPEPTTGCWLWTGAISTSGYGSLSVNGKTMRAHRAAWLATHGPIPPGLHVLHHCDQPACVNAPGGHLFLGTDADNTRDALRKGRRSGGGEANAAKTHCPRGHAYAGANLYSAPGRNGKKNRLCRQCNTLLRRARRGARSDSPSTSTGKH